MPFVINWILKPTFLRNVLKNMGEMEDYINDNCTDLNYTIVRPPGLANNPVTGMFVCLSVCHSVCLSVSLSPSLTHYCKDMNDTIVRSTRLVNNRFTGLSGVFFLSICLCVYHLHLLHH